MGRSTIAEVSVAPIPITVLGGYLGAGKTTLVNRVLRESQGRRIGVVVNDFGELAIDAALIEAAATQGGAAAGAGPIVNLANGCVCCTLGAVSYTHLTLPTNTVTCS